MSQFAEKTSTSRTELPLRIVSPEALRETTLPFDERGDHIVVWEALTRLEIQLLINLTREIRKSRRERNEFTNRGRTRSGPDNYERGRGSRSPDYVIVEPYDAEPSYERRRRREERRSFELDRDYPGRSKREHVERRSDRAGNRERSFDFRSRREPDRDYTDYIRRGHYERDPDGAGNREREFGFRSYSPDYNRRRFLATAEGYTEQRRERLRRDRQRSRRKVDERSMEYDSDSSYRGSSPPRGSLNNPLYFTRNTKRRYNEGGRGVASESITENFFDRTPNRVVQDEDLYLQRAVREQKAREQSRHELEEKLKREREEVVNKLRREIEEEERREALEKQRKEVQEKQRKLEESYRKELEEKTKKMEEKQREEEERYKREVVEKHRKEAEEKERKEREEKEREEREEKWTKKLKKMLSKTLKNELGRLKDDVEREELERKQVELDEKQAELEALESEIERESRKRRLLERELEIERQNKMSLPPSSQTFARSGKKSKAGTGKKDAIRKHQTAPEVGRPSMPSPPPVDPQEVSNIPNDPISSITRGPGNDAPASMKDAFSRPPSVCSQDVSDTQNDPTSSTTRGPEIDAPASMSDSSSPAFPLQYSTLLEFFAGPDKEKTGLLTLAQLDQFKAVGTLYGILYLLSSCLRRNIEDGDGYIFLADLNGVLKEMGYAFAPGCEDKFFNELGLARDGKAEFDQIADACICLGWALRQQAQDKVGHVTTHHEDDVSGGFVALIRALRRTHYQLGIMPFVRIESDRDDWYPESRISVTEITTAAAPVTLSTDVSIPGAPAEVEKMPSTESFTTADDDWGSFSEEHAFEVHSLTKHSETINLANWKTMIRKLPRQLHENLMLHNVFGSGPCWTCTPPGNYTVDKIPLTIAGVPVVVPVAYQYPLVTATIPPPDPHPHFIDPSTAVDEETVNKIFDTFEDALGFYLLINGMLQIMVPEDFDMEYALSHRPNVFGGLRVSYINQDMVPTVKEPGDDLGSTTSVNTGPSASTIFTQPTEARSSFSSVYSRARSSMTESSLMPHSATESTKLKLGSTVQAEVKKSKAKERFSGKIGLVTTCNDRRYMIVSTHMLTQALLGAKSDSFPGHAWTKDVAVVSSNGRTHVRIPRRQFTPRRVTNRHLAWKHRRNL